MSTITGTVRLVAYARVSTARQARSGLGLEAQEHKINAAADMNGYDVVKWCVDRGESAKTTDRPALREALQLIADGEADGLICSRLDRLARSVADFGEMLA